LVRGTLFAQFLALFRSPALGADHHFLLYRYIFSRMRVSKREFEDGPFREMLTAQAKLVNNKPVFLHTKSLEDITRAKFVVSSHRPSSQKILTQSVDRWASLDLIALRACLLNLHVAVRAHPESFHHMGAGLAEDDPLLHRA
jgi:hypothetical protein